MRFWMVLALTAAVACDNGTTTDDKDTDATRTDDIIALAGDAAAGEIAYDDNCSLCHAVDGSGLSGPSMQGMANRLSKQEIVDLILEGGDTMPAFDSLADQDVADILVHVMAF